MEHVFEAFLYKLMRSADKIESIDVIELCCDLASEKPACSSWRDGPCLYVFGIAPHEITEGALMRNLTHSLNCPYLHMHMSFPGCSATELCSDLAPKQSARSSREICSCLHVFKIAPHKITEGPLARNLKHLLYGPHLHMCPFDTRCAGMQTGSLHRLRLLRCCQAGRSMSHDIHFCLMMLIGLLFQCFSPSPCQSRMIPPQETLDRLLAYLV